MATIDLGKIKLVWRGTYAGGTAYTVDDVVQHTDGGITSSFICTTNSTGNAPSTGGSVHGSWAYLAKGSGDATLTTQGDILYRDGSGNQRLAKGTAGQVLKINSGATAPEWGTDVGGKIEQVLQTTKTSTFSHTFGSGISFQNITGLSQAITPTATSSKVLLMVTVNAYGAAGCQAYIDTIRDSTRIFIGDADANRALATAMANFNGSTADWSTSNIHYTFLDSPNTTSATTYQVRLGGFNSGVNHINRSDRDSNSTNYDARLASSITLMEILA